MKHYLQFKDLRAEEYAYLFERTRTIKTRFKNYERYQPLVDRTLAMIFEKASTRTRVSFEAGVYQMGGSVVHLTTGDSHLGRAEPIEDSARVISRMVDLVLIRTYEHTKIEAFAAHSRVRRPVTPPASRSLCPPQYLVSEVMHRSVPVKFSFITPRPMPGRDPRSDHRRVQAPPTGASCHR